MSAKRAEVVARVRDEDLRDELRKKDRYGTRPEALSSWFYEQKLGMAAEWLYWLMWDRACMSNSYVVCMSVEALAGRIRVSESAARRAIAALIKAGAIRRTRRAKQDGCFREPVALTEVLLPMEVCKKLPFIKPRGSASQGVIVTEQGIDATSSSALAPTSLPAPDRETPPVYSIPRQILRLKARNRFSREEEDNWLAWKSGKAPTFAFSTNSRLSGEERQEVLEAKAIVVSQPDLERPFPDAGAPPVLLRTIKPKGLDFFTAERLRRRIAEVAPSELRETYFQEITWSMQFGSLGKLGTLHHSMNSALKLVREKRWSQPTRMPASYKFTPREARA